MDRKTPAGGAGGEGEDEQRTERPVSGCLGRAPRGPTRAGQAGAPAFASARDPSLREGRVHTDGRARQALSASSHLLSRLLHRASSPSESRHRTRFSAPTSRTSQTDRRRRQGNRGRGFIPLTGARTGWGARSPSIQAARVVRHHPAEKTPLRAAQRVGFSPSTAKMGAQARFRTDSSMWLSALRRPDDGGRTEIVVSRRPAECLQVRTSERVVFNPKVEEQSELGAKETRRAGLFEQPVDDPRSERRVHQMPRRPRLGYVLIPHSPYQPCMVHGKNRIPYWIDWEFDWPCRT